MSPLSAIQIPPRACASRLQRMRMVRATVAESVDTDIDLVEKVLVHSLSGGKGLRALIAHISTDWCGLPNEACNNIAAAMEMIHVASLLHDDIVDDAALRRHKPSANYQFGPAAAVLTGDFLYSRASQLLCSSGNLALLSEVADATNLLAEGEMLQLAKQGGIADEQDYFEVIRRKTAALFSACAATGPVVTEQIDMIEPMRNYGMQVGMAFQLMDDCLDYASSSAETGKQVGTDFVEGKTTLPLLRAREHADTKQQIILDEAFAQRDAPEAFTRVLEVITKTDALASVKQDAQVYVAKSLNALESLAASPQREMLANFARKSLHRTN